MALAVVLDFAKFADFEIPSTFMGRVALVKNRMEHALVSNRFTELGVSERPDVRGSTQPFQDVWAQKYYFHAKVDLFFLLSPSPIFPLTIHLLPLPGWIVLHHEQNRKKGAGIV